MTEYVRVTFIRDKAGSGPDRSTHPNPQFWLPHTGSRSVRFTLTSTPITESTAIAASAATGAPRDVHIRACLDHGADAFWWDTADVLYYRAPVSGVDVQACMQAYPGCAVCAGCSPSGRIILAVRFGANAHIACNDRAVSARRIRGCASLASAVHAWIVAGPPPGSMLRKSKPLRS